MEKNAAYYNSLSTFGVCRHFHLHCKMSVENISQVKKKTQCLQNLNINCLSVFGEIKVLPSPSTCFCQ